MAYNFKVCPLYLVKDVYVHAGSVVIQNPFRLRCLDSPLFLGFQTQRIPTDAAGNAAPGAKTISQILAGGPPPPTPPVTQPVV